VQAKILCAFLLVAKENYACCSIYDFCSKLTNQITNYSFHGAPSFFHKDIVILVSRLVRYFLTFYETKNVHNRVHKIMSHIPFLIQTNPVTSSCRFKIRFNITLPSTPRSSIWYFVFKFPIQANQVLVPPPPSENATNSVCSERVKLL
jgi:hypothetical protein